MAIILCVMLICSNGLMGLAEEHADLQFALVEPEATEKSPAIMALPDVSGASMDAKEPLDSENQSVDKTEDETEPTLLEEFETVIPREEIEVDIEDLEVPLSDGSPENDLLSAETNDVEEASIFEGQEAAPFIFTVAWEYDLEKEPFSNEIRLRADNDQGFSDAGLQWQVAKKLQPQLNENEKEWMDIEGKENPLLEISASRRMTDWRWRLKVVQADGVVSVSHEMKLPNDFMTRLNATSTEDLIEVNEDAKENKDEASSGMMAESPTLPLPTITFHTDSLENEIYIGSNVFLKAEIADFSEEMELQWQFFDSVTQEWTNVEDATQLEHRYIMDEINCLYLWRLLLTVPQMPEETPENLSEAEDALPGEADFEADTYLDTVLEPSKVEVPMNHDVDVETEEEPLETGTEEILAEP